MAGIFWTKHLKTFGTYFIILIDDPVFANVLILVERLLNDWGFSIIALGAHPTLSQGLMIWQVFTSNISGTHLAKSADPYFIRNHYDVLIRVLADLMNLANLRKDKMTLNDRSNSVPYRLLQVLLELGNKRRLQTLWRVISSIYRFILLSLKK